MQIEIIILLEIIAFSFLAFGLIPFKNGDENNPPLMNRMIFILISTILFFSLAVTAVQYEYTYCYINQTISDYSLNTTTVDTGCADHPVENIGLSYINWGFGIVGTLLAFILMILIGFTNKGRKNIED